MRIRHSAAFLNLWNFFSDYIKDFVNSESYSLNNEYFIFGQKNKILIALIEISLQIKQL